MRVTPIVPDLTRREEQVIDLIADGHSVTETAAIMGISYQTARKMRDNAVRKLDAPSTTAAAVKFRALRAAP